MIIDDNPSIGYGHAKFVLGFGSEGVFGHVDLFLRASPDGVKVNWEADGHVPEKDRRQTEQATLSYLTGYLARYSVPFCATITQVSRDPERRNDYERAVRLAIYDALQQMRLPLPQIFATSEDEND